MNAALAQRHAALENARGYSARMAAKAREHHKAGWEPSDIRLLLEREFGVTPSIPTVRRWVFPAERELDRNGKKTRLVSARDAERLAKLREMRERGMSLKSISIAASMFLGEELSAEQVKTRLEGRRGYSKGAKS